MSVTKVTGMMQTGTKGGDISSASPTVVDTDGDYFDIAGTTNFAAFTVVAGRRFTAQFDGVLTMTHHATNLDLPGGANITTAAGDVAEFFATGTNTVQCVNYTRANGTPIALSNNSVDETKLKDALISDFSDATVTASDYFIHGDATASGNTKKDTVQGILDLVPSAGFTYVDEEATTSGTSVTLETFAAGTSLIHLIFEGVSENGTAHMSVTLGDAGGIETSGYLSTCERSGSNYVISTSNFKFEMAYADAALDGIMTLARVNDSHVWIASFTGRLRDNMNLYVGGSKTLSGELTQINIVPDSGAFDAGAVRALYI